MSDAQMGKSQLIKREIPFHIVQMHLERFDGIKRNLGSSVDEIFQDLSRREEIGSAIAWFISWKSWNDIPLTDLESAIESAGSMMIDVSNGGFHQYFVNSSGSQWKIVLDLTQKIGDHDGYELFKSVLKIFPRSKPSISRHVRWEQLEKLELKMGQAMWDHFEEASRQFGQKRFPDDDKVWDWIVENRKNIEILWM